VRILHAVIVGAGQAGCAIAVKLREEGFDGCVTLIGQEPHAPYQRPPLAKAFLAGEAAPESLLLRPPAFFAERDIALLTGTRVETLDAATRQLRFADGTTLAYDFLTLATGALPRRLPPEMGGELDGVLTLRTVADAARLSGELLPGRAVVIVGGGYLGLEIAAACVKRGMTVTVLEAAPRILARVACAETAAVMRDLHASHGVTILEDTLLETLVGTGRVEAARLSDGREIPADLVLVAIGVLPDIALAAEAGLAIDNGIAVDAHLRTSAPDIWAAGDCAALEFRGLRQRIESVGNAIDMAETVARNMLGQSETFEPHPWFWSDQYDCHLQIAGHNFGHDAVHVRTGGAGRSHWYYRQDELLAVDAIDDARAYMVGKRLIEQGRSPPPAMVCDPSTDLKALLRG
jgi:3-phenylpropionate/trans-cinnamate dioxygenase ferredoxin reductase subunit